MKFALRCDVQPMDETEEHEDKWKRKHPDSHPSRRQDREDEVDTIYHELQGINIVILMTHLSFAFGPE